MYYSLNELEQAIHAYLKKDNLEGALRDISEFVLTIINQPSTTGVLFSSAILDALCQKIGVQTFIPPLVSAPQEELVIYIASEVMNSGGHNAVIKDLITLQPTKKHIILLTNLFNRPDCEKMQDSFANLPVQLMWPNDDSFVAKLKWLQDKLLDLNPKRTFLFNHHHDSIAIAAVQPSLNHELLFYHHGDHHLCLGVHLDHALHVDPHAFGFFNCRDKLHVKNNVYWPLVTLDRPYRTPKECFLADGFLRTCSSGNHSKFESTYAFSYLSLMPDILKTTQGVHIHIGSLSTQSLEKIYQKMAALYIPLERFVHIPWVESVWQAMLDYRIDLYISSFPRVGLKATIEVLGSSTPIIFHENYASQLLGAHFIGYPEAFVWQHSDELLAHLTKLTAKQLADESKLARACYEKNYRVELLAEELNKPKEEMKGFPPQALSSFTVDQFQMCLDTVQEFDRLHNQMQTVQNEIYQSTSWRITAPLRALKDKSIQYKRAIINLIKVK
jgi:hypothetical protein